MTTRHCWLYPRRYWRGCPILIGGQRAIIPMVQPKDRLTARALRKMAEDYYIAENGHSPPYMVVVKVPVAGGFAVGVAYVEQPPTKID